MAPTLESPAVAPDEHETPSLGLPVIDAAALANATDACDPAVQSLRTACSEVGFFCIGGAAVPSSVVDSALRVSTDFFNLSLDTKKGCVGTAANGWRGYGAYGCGQNCSPNSVKPERKETFYYGTPNPEETTVSVEDIAGFDAAVAEFHDAMLNLTKVLLRGLSLSLDMPVDYFEKAAYQEPDAKVLLTCYPPIQDCDEVSCGSHTDCGFLTILCAEGGSGLQVRNRDGKWISVESRRDLFVCNIGDLAARWTDYQYRSTPHRVLNLSGEARRSIIFFNNMDKNAIVGRLPSDAKAETPAKLPNVTCGEYVAARLAHMRKGYEGDAEFKVDNIEEPDMDAVLKADVSQMHLCTKHLEPSPACD